MASPLGIQARRRIDFGCDAVTHHAAIIGRQHADQGVRPPVHLQDTAKRGGVGGETLAPEAVAHHCDRAAFVVLGVEASGGRMDAEQVEELGLVSIAQTTSLRPVRCQMAS